MDVLTKKWVFLWPRDGEKLFDPWAFGRKGRERPQEIRTKKFMFVLFFFPNSHAFYCLAPSWARTAKMKFLRLVCLLNMMFTVPHSPSRDAMCAEVMLCSAMSDTQFTPNGLKLRLRGGNCTKLDPIGGLWIAIPPPRASAGHPSIASLSSSKGQDSKPEHSNLCLDLLLFSCWMPERSSETN